MQVCFSVVPHGELTTAAISRSPPIHLEQMTYAHSTSIITHFSRFDAVAFQSIPAANFHINMDKATVIYTPLGSSPLNSRNSLVTTSRPRPTKADWQRWKPMIMKRYKIATVRMLVAEINAEDLEVT